MFDSSTPMPVGLHEIDKAAPSKESRNHGSGCSLATQGRIGSPPPSSGWEAVAAASPGRADEPAAPIAEDVV
jgi:hypothetical protein